MSESTISKKKNLTLFGFFAMTASMVMTVYEYPTFASSGFNLVFFLLVGGFLWFIPVALCAAEMATIGGWEKGGVYTWVGKTLGKKFGFAAISFQWFEISVGFVTMIYFILGALSYVFNWPALNSNPVIKFIGVLVIFWALVASQMGGTKYTAIIAKVGFIGGIVLPALILFGLGIAYIVQGNPTDVVISTKTFVPDFTKLNTLVVFVSFILAYMGVEASATHANEMANPKKQYPLAMLMLVIIAIIFNTIGGLTVAAVIPAEQLNLSAGVVQTFQALISHFTTNGSWIVKVIALLLSLGVMAEISSWVVGPSRGMNVAAKDGILPEALSKVNKHDVPVPLIVIQGVLVSIWAAVLTFGGGSSNVSFFTAMSLTVVIYLVGYFLFFIGYFVLVNKHPEMKGAYQIPGGKVVKNIVAFLGFATSVFAFVISFVPPAQLGSNYVGEYLSILVVCFLLVLIAPFAVYDICRKHNHNTNSAHDHNHSVTINSNGTVSYNIKKSNNSNNDSINSTKQNTNKENEIKK